MNLWFRFFWLLWSWRFRSRVGFFDKVQTPFRVWPSDLDANMHMNNGVYLSIMDLGRFDLVFRSSLAEVMKKNGWYPVVASQTIRYRRALQPFQKFEIHTQVVGWDERFFYIQQSFVSRSQVIAMAMVKGRFLKKQGGGVSPGDIAGSVGESRVSPEVPSWVLDWVRSEEEAWKGVVP